MTVPSLAWLYNLPFIRFLLTLFIHPHDPRWKCRAYLRASSAIDLGHWSLSPNTGVPAKQGALLQIWFPASPLYMVLVLLCLDHSWCIYRSFSTGSMKALPRRDRTDNIFNVHHVQRSECIGTGAVIYLSNSRAHVKRRKSQSNPIALESDSWLLSPHLHWVLEPLQPLKRRKIFLELSMSMPTSNVRSISGKHRMWIPPASRIKLWSPDLIGLAWGAPRFWVSILRKSE